MGSEILLYGYGAVCVCMMIFNIVYSFMLKGKDHRLEKRMNYFQMLIENQIQRLKDEKEVEEEHFNLLNKRLKNVSNLVAFNRVLDRYLEQEKDEFVCEYYQQIQPVVLSLAVFYEKDGNVKAAYYAYFISKYGLMVDTLLESIQQILVGYMQKNNLYCRINALQALYNHGTEEKIAEAIVSLDRQGNGMNEKILTDGLVSFQGDYDYLINLLWEKFDTFTNKTKLSVMNYIRFKSGSFRKEMLKIMNDPNVDKELRLSAIRYFERYYCEEARESLLRFASEKDPSHWEYAAVSMTALAKYQGEDVFQTLLNGIHSSNWYVRSNAAISLEAKNLQYTDLIEVVGGNDRYAREMLMYRLEMRQMKKKEQERK